MKRIVFPILALATATSAMAQIKETWSNTLSDPMTHYESRDVAVAPNSVTFTISKYGAALCRMSSYDGQGNRMWTSQLPVLATNSMRVHCDQLGVPTAAILSTDNKVHVIRVNPVSGNVDWHIPIDEADKLVDFDCDPLGNLIVTYESTLDNCVRISKFTPAGAPMFTTSSGMPDIPSRMTSVSANGQIYVSFHDRTKHNGIMALTPNGTIRFVKSWESYYQYDGSYQTTMSHVVSDRNGRVFTIDADSATKGLYNIRTFDSLGNFSVQQFGEPGQSYPAVTMDSENRIVVCQFSVTPGFAIAWYNTSTNGVALAGTSKVDLTGTFQWGFRKLVADSFGQTYLLGTICDQVLLNKSVVWVFEPSKPLPVWSYKDMSECDLSKGGGVAVGRWGQVSMTATIVGNKLSEGVTGIKQMGFRNMLINGSSHTGGRTITGTANFYSSSDTNRNVALLSNTPYATVGAPTTTVVAGQSQSVFSVDLKPTAVRRAVRIDGTYNGTTRSVVFYLEPPVAASVTLYPVSVKGGMKANATARLNGDAPAGGINVAITSNNPSATVPAALTIPEGDISKGFQVNTTAVSQTTTATISATANNVTKTATLTITP